MKKRISSELSNKIYKMNFFLACLIVFLHSSCAGNLNADQSFYLMTFKIQKFIAILADAAVPLFFMISAYLLFRNYKITNYKKMIIKRSKSLLFPYLIWSALGWGMYVLLTYIPVIARYINQERVSLAFNDIIYDIAMATYNPPIWFARTLFVFVLVSPVIYYLLKKLGKYMMAIIIVVFVLNIVWKAQYSGIRFWLPEYLLGAWLATTDYIENNMSKNRSQSWLASVVLALLVGIMTLIGIKDDNPIYYIYRFLSACLLWGAADIASNLWKTKPKEWYCISFFMFCAHSCVVMIIRKIVIIPLGFSNISVLISYFCVAIVSIIGIINAAAIIKKQRLVWTLLNGGR